MSEEKVIYEGGHHYIVCDGKNHYRVTPEWNQREYDCPCWCDEVLTIV